MMNNDDDDDYDDDDDIPPLQISAPFQYSFHCAESPPFSVPLMLPLVFHYVDATFFDVLVY